MGCFTSIDSGRYGSQSQDRLPSERIIWESPGHSTRRGDQPVGSPQDGSHDAPHPSTNWRLLLRRLYGFKHKDVSDDQGTSGLKDRGTGDLPLTALLCRPRLAQQRPCSNEQRTLRAVTSKIQGAAVRTNYESVIESWPALRPFSPRLLIFVHVVYSDLREAAKNAPVKNE